MKEKNKTKNGFTLVETLLVISILGLVGFTSFVYLNGERGKSILKEAQASLINALEIARSHSVSGMGSNEDKKYGVRIDDDSIVIFEGTNEISKIFLPPGISTDSSGLEILFNRIKGNISTSSNIIINLFHSITSQTTTVTITPEGKIEY